MNAAVVSKQKVIYSQLALKEAVGTDYYVSGFASTSAMDRDGDVIDPAKFATKEFMRNPQLWVNHQLWTDAKGNGVAAGVVDAVTKVQAILSDDGRNFSLKDLDTDSEIRTIAQEDFPAIKNKEKGLWVVCKVIEADVIKFCEDGRYNAFSWQGIMYRNQQRKIVSIDLFEVSLVSVPNNQNASFQIGKSLTLEDTDGHITNIDLEAIAHLTATKDMTALSPVEIALFNANKSPESPAANEITGKGKTEYVGGEQEMKEVLTKLAEMQTSLAVLPELDTSVKALGTRLDTLEEKATKIEDSTTKEVPKTEAKDGSDNSDAASKDTDKQQDKTVTKEADPNPEVLKALASIAKQLESVDTLNTAVKALGSRLDAFEGTTTDSKALSDEQGSTDKLELETALKNLAGLGETEINNRAKAALAAKMIPPGIGCRK